MEKELFSDLYQKLMADKNNNKKTKSGCFDYFVDEILEDKKYRNNAFKVSSKSFKNYYEKFVEEKASKTGEPKIGLKNLVAEFLEYDDYLHYCNSKANEKTNSKHQNWFIKNKKQLLLSIAVLTLTFIALLYYKQDYTSNSNCIKWNVNRFEKVSCLSENSINNSIYTINIEKFKQLTLTKNTIFFKEGIPIVWYGKNDKGIIEYFSFRGIHPKTLKPLKPITRYILNKERLLNE